MRRTYIGTKNVEKAIKGQRDVGEALDKKNTNVLNSHRLVRHPTLGSGLDAALSHLGPCLSLSEKRAPVGRFLTVLGQSVTTA